jgi:hypothetical protein
MRRNPVATQFCERCDKPFSYEVVPGVFTKSSHPTKLCPVCWKASPEAEHADRIIQEVRDKEWVETLVREQFDEVLQHTVRQIFSERAGT